MWSKMNITRRPARVQTIIDEELGEKQSPIFKGVRFQGQFWKNTEKTEAIF